MTDTTSNTTKFRSLKGYRRKRFSLANIKSKLQRYHRFFRTAVSAPKRYNASPWTLIKRFRALRRAHRMNWSELLLKGYLDPSLSDEVLADVVIHSRSFPLQVRLDPGPLIDQFDKARFYAKCAANGIPIPTFHALVTDQEHEAIEGVPKIHALGDWQRFWAQDSIPELIIKPVFGDRGNAVYSVTRDRNRLNLHDGRSFSIDGFYQYLLQQGYRHWLLQDRLYGHRDLQTLTGTNAGQTVRLIVYRGESGAPVVLVGWLRIVVGSGITDNFASGSSGNYVATVDVASGRLDNTMGFGEGGIGFQPVTTHPVTQAPFADFQVPFWEESKQVAMDAATAFAPLRALAWDVCITDDGPFMIEANARWGALDGLSPQLVNAYKYLSKRADELGV